MHHTLTVASPARADKPTDYFSQSGAAVYPPAAVFLVEIFFGLLSTREVKRVGRGLQQHIVKAFQQHPANGRRPSNDEMESP